MEEKKYLDEATYQSNKQRVKKAGTIIITIGLALLVVGLIVLVIGFANFGGHIKDGLQGENANVAASIFGGVGLIGLGGALAAIGFPVTVAGLVIKYIVGNGREINAFATQQVMPVAKEGIEQMTPAVSNAAKKVSKSITEGIEEAKKKK